MRHALLSATAVALLGLASCGTGPEITRTSDDAVRDLSGEWNKTDSKLVANELVPQMAAHPSIDAFQATHGRKPVVRSGKITVRTGEVINQEIIFDSFLEAFIDSGKVTVVASSGEAGEARAERKDQDINAAAETRKASVRETGADFLLSGQINTQDDQVDGKRQKYYKITMWLVDVTTQEMIARKSTEITKNVDR
jgi:penicillin-binding protein activator